MLSRSHRTLLFGIGSLGVLLLLYWFLPLFLPFLVALFLAGVIDRPVRRAQERLGLSRGSAVILVLASMLTAGGVILFVLVGNVVAEAEVLLRHLPEYAAQWSASLERILQAAENFSARMPPPLDHLLAGTLERVTEGIGLFAAGLLDWAQRLPNVLLGILITALSTYFICRDQRSLAAFFLRFVPREWHPHLLEVRRLVVDGLFGLVKAQMILLALTVAVTTAAFLLFEVRYAWLLGILAGLFDLVPVVGPGAVYIPVVVLFAAADKYASALGIAAIWLALIVSRQVLEPKVIGAQVGLHPLTMIVALYLGIRLFGVNGVWLGPCVAIGIRAIYTVTHRSAPAG